MHVEMFRALHGFEYDLEQLGPAWPAVTLLIVAGKLSVPVLRMFDGSEPLQAQGHRSTRVP